MNLQSLLEAPWPKLPVSPRLRAVSFRRLTFRYVGIETRLPVIRRRSGGARKTMWLFTDQNECDSRIPGKLAVFVRSSNVERRFGPCLRNVLEWVPRDQRVLFTMC